MNERDYDMTPGVDRRDPIGYILNGAKQTLIAVHCYQV
jgi:hypothetical protein